MEKKLSINVRSGTLGATGNSSTWRKMHVLPLGIFLPFLSFWMFWFLQILKATNVSHARKCSRFSRVIPWQSSPAEKRKHLLFLAVWTKSSSSVRKRKTITKLGYFCGRFVFSASMSKLVLMLTISFSMFALKERTIGRWGRRCWLWGLYMQNIERRESWLVDVSFEICIIGDKTSHVTGRNLHLRASINMGLFGASKTCIHSFWFLVLKQRRDHILIYTLSGSFNRPTFFYETSLLYAPNCPTFQVMSRNLSHSIVVEI